MSTCSNGDERKLLKFEGNAPVVIQGPQTLLGPNQLSLRFWFENIKEYFYQERVLVSDECMLFPLNSNTIIIKAEWSEDVVDADQTFEVSFYGDGSSEAYWEIGSSGYTGPSAGWNLGGTGPSQTIKCKDFIMLNNNDDYDKMVVCNTSTKSTNIAIFHAKNE